MGTINEDISQNDVEFKNLEKVLNYILSQEKNKSHNIDTLKEIGLANQYSSLLDKKTSKEIKCISKKHKTLKYYISLQKAKSYFIKWTNLLFDIQESDYNCFPNYSKKIQNLRNILFTKSFFQKNVKKNLIENESNLKLLEYGIPKYLREFLWEIIIAEKYSNHKYFDRYEEEKEYKTFIKNYKIEQTDNQIEKDILRTFPDISDSNDNKINILKNLLIYTSSLTKDGYCQGMNFIVSFILKITNFDEIKSYYFIKYIFPEIKGYFEQGFPLLKKNINLFYKFFSKLYPTLDAHFTKNDVFAQFWVGKWLQTLFTLSLPFDELCYIWDLLLIKGFDFCILISLAIINYLEKYLMKLNDSSDILSYLKYSLSPDTNNFYNINDNTDKNKYIIPINKIFMKSIEIEHLVDNDKTLKQIINNSKKEDCESICSLNTKETETSMINNKFYMNNSLLLTTSSSKSILSENNTFRSSIKSDKKDISNKGKENLFNKNNLEFTIPNNNVNINDNLSKINENFFTDKKNKKVFHLFDNIDLMERRLNYLNVNINYLQVNLGNYYNSFSPTPNYIYLNNNLLISPKAPYYPLTICPAI